MTAHPTRRLPRSLAWIAAFALAGAAVLFGAQPASAHDALISTDPAADATVPSLPAKVTLTFNEDVLDEAGGTIVEVKDAAGTSLTTGDPAVSQNVVTQPLTGNATGQITVTWRVVSSDGHPVSNSFSFTVAGAASPSPSAPATTSPTASATPVPTTTPPQSAAPISAPAQEGADVLPWIIGGVIALAAIAAVVALMAARARQGKDTAQSRTTGRDDLGGR